MPRGAGETNQLLADEMALAGAGRDHECAAEVVAPAD